MQDQDATNPAAGEPVRADELGVAEAADEAEDFELEVGEEGREGDGPAPDEPLPGEDLEEIEFDGRKFRVPAALKGALMMQADYTRKTQEVAQHRQALEQREASLEQQAETLEASFHDRARLVLIDQTLASYDDLDWDAWEAEDPQGAQALLRQHIQLKEARAELAGRLRQDEDEQVLIQQRTRAALAQEGHAVLSREIPGWGAELQAKLARAAQDEFGFTAGELSQVLDPRLIKLLHAAWEGRRSQAQFSQAQRHLRAQIARPASQVGGNAQAARDPRRMSTEDWMRHRNDQLKKKGR